MHTVKRAVSRDFFCEKRASDSKELGTGLKHRDERRGALGSSSWQAQQAALSSQRLTGFVQVAVDEKVELISAEGHPAGHSGAQACSGAASAENCASRELNKVLPAKSWSEAFPPSLVSFPPLAAPDSHWSSSRSDAASDSLGSFGRGANEAGWFVRATRGALGWALPSLSRCCHLRLRQLGAAWTGRFYLPLFCRWIRKSASCQQRASLSSIVADIGLDSRQTASTRRLI